MTALTIGVFDGVHRGHQHLFQVLANKGSLIQAITFSNHPAEVLKPSATPLQLTPLPLKLALLEDAGIEKTHVLSFTQELAELSYTDFLAPYSMEHLIVGDDAAIGRGRLGTPDALRLLGLQKGFQVHVVPKLQDRAEPLSSTRIRAAVAQGNLEEAERLLGRPYCFMMSKAKLYAALPPDGNYPVWAHSPAGIISTTLKIQNRIPSVHLESPQLISFGPNLKPGIFDRLCQQTSLAAL